MESSQNSLTIEQSSQEKKADLLVVAALHKEKNGFKKFLILNK
jgi:hypothetical protein